MDIDFSDSQLPEDELREVKRRYNEELRNENMRATNTLKRARLCFGGEQYYSGGFDCPEFYTPVIDLGIVD